MCCTVYMLAITTTTTITYSVVCIHEICDQQAQVWTLKGGVRLFVCLFVTVWFVFDLVLSEFGRCFVFVRYQFGSCFVRV